MKGDLFISIIVIWLLPLTTSVTESSHQNQNFLSVTTGDVKNNSTEGQMTTQSNLHPFSEVSDPNITLSIGADEFPTTGKTRKPRIKHSLPKTQTTRLQTDFPTIQTSATPAHSSSSQINTLTSEQTTTGVQVKDKTSATLVVTTQASNPTTITKTRSILTSLTQGQGTRNQPSTSTSTSAFQFTHDTMAYESPRPAVSTRIISTATTSIKPNGSILTSLTQGQGTRNQPSTSTSKSAFQFTHDKMPYESPRPAEYTRIISTATTSIKPNDNTPRSTRTGTQSTDLSKASVATTNTSFRNISTRKEKKAKSNKDTNQSKIVAGIIGGVLVLMMVGFLVIFIKKRKFQKQPSTDWAGPSPFLESGADNGTVKVRSINRVSLSSFLPQRLSKRLSLLPEMGEELEDMAPGATFGNKHAGPASNQENEETNGTTITVPEMKIPGDALEAVENSVSEPSSQMINPPSRNISDAASF